MYFFRHDFLFFRFVIFAICCAIAGAGADKCMPVKNKSGSYPAPERHGRADFSRSDICCP
jgi:hypothetical protein